MHLAAEYGHVEIVKVLIGAEGDIEAKNTVGQTLSRIIAS